MSSSGITRRQFIAASIATAALSSTRSLAQARNRAAVVIGVDQSGTLPKLRAAASGARQVGKWLRAEGFEVAEFVDDAGKVSAGPIFTSVSRLVERGTLDQLVIYFSGHGMNVSFNELWFLSDAPHNGNEAISLQECVELARETAISNVVFISDACRSTADSLQAHRVRGQYIFPNPGTLANRGVEVDRFYAAHPGDPAYEIAVDQSAAGFEGIFTSVLLDAFTRPDFDMVSSIGGLSVVKNRDLRKYLAREVPRRAEEKSIRLRQFPDSRVESDDYIGKAVLPIAHPPPAGCLQGCHSIPAPAPPPPGGGPVSGQRPVTIADVAGVALQREGVNPLGTDRTALSDEAVAKLAGESGFTGVQSTIVRASARADVPKHFETGVIVHGAGVARAMTTPGIHTELLERGDGDAQPAILRLDRRPGSVALRFTAGNGVVIPNLPEFLATVVVRDGGVIDVSYAPAQTSYRWHEYESQASSIAELRATVAAAAKFGVFRIEGTTVEGGSRAEEFANRIRMYKGIDPSLGLYAAYAYSDAGYLERVRSVDEIMHNDLGASLFDISMLAGSMSRRMPIVPFCPLLNQGWGLLRVRNVTLPPELNAAVDHRLSSLWTTFDPEGMRSVEAFVGRRPHAIAQV